MPLIIHRTDPGPIPADAAGLPLGRLVILAAPEAAEFPAGAGRLGGGTIRLGYLGAAPSAFRVLADCARLLRRIPAAAGEGLDYRRQDAPSPRLDEAADIDWQAEPDGRITAFRLSPGAAGDPLLPLLTAELADQPLTDARRFAFLAAALAGPAADAAPDTTAQPPEPQ